MYILLHRKVYLMFLSVSIHLHCVHLQQQDDVQFFFLFIYSLMLSANYRSTSAPKTCRSLVCKLCVFVKNFLMWRQQESQGKIWLENPWKSHIPHQSFTSPSAFFYLDWHQWSLEILIQASQFQEAKPRRHGGSPVGPTGRSSGGVLFPSQDSI